MAAELKKAEGKILELDAVLRVYFKFLSKTKHTSIGF